MFVIKQHFSSPEDTSITKLYLLF